MLERLKRRGVVRALVAWGVIAFALLQVIEPVMHGLELPDRVLKVAVVLLGLGFPVTALLAWALELRAEASLRAAAGDEAGAAPLTRGQRAWPAFLAVGLGLVAAAPGVAYYLVWRDPGPGPAAAVAAPAGPASVAVLPFVNMTADPGQEYFADGVAEEILNALAHLPGLQVTGRTSSFSFKGRNDDLRAIGAKLNVGAVLEGSVRRAGARVRVTAQLVKVADGYHLWSETFDRALDDVFAVQDEIASAVAAALRVKLLPGPHVAEVPRPASGQAYDLFLLGRELNHRGSLEARRRAEEVLEQAVAADPGYAPAWSALASARLNRVSEAHSAAEAETYRRRGWEAAGKAVALAPRWADGWRVRGNTRARDRWDWAGAAADLDRALALAPNDYAVIADRALSLLAPVGRADEAIRETRRALALEPLSSTLWSSLCWLELHAGQAEAAQAACGRALELSPENLFARVYQAELLLQAHQPQAALEAAGRIADEESRLVHVAMALHDLGRAAEAGAVLDDLARRFGADVPYDLARVHAWRGERDQAFAWLEKAAAQRDPDLCSLKVELRRALSGDPRWGPLVARLGLPP